MRHIRALYIFLTFILLSSTSIVQAAPEQRTALVIGNSAYSSGPLKNPVNDATDMAAALQRLGFSVIIKKNASQRVMEESIQELGNKLKRGGVGLFYYAGHGLQVNGVNYLIPVAAKINQESDVKYEAVDVNRVLDEMANASNGLNIVMLDACRDNPYARRFRNATRGLAIVSTAPTGTLISYSTGPGQVAQDGDGRNSPYTAALIQYMKQPGMTIEQVFKSVRSKLGKQTGGKQVPWELSSLQGDFYFVPGKLSAPVISTPSAPETASDDRHGDSESSRADLDYEQKKIDAEKNKLTRERELLEQKKALAEQKRRLAEMRKQFATVEKRPSASAANEIKRDGRFIDNGNGTVTDTKTGLMWAAKDNGSNINWENAKSYCENYRGGGYTDWRLPTQDELAGLYDGSKNYRATQRDYNVYLTELIQLSTCCPWASETSGSDAVYFYFNVGSRYWGHQSEAKDIRALPVRSGK